MRRLSLLLLLVCFAAGSHAQYVYKGAIDKYEVEFLIDSYPDGMVTAVYAYDRFDRPIRINGRQTDSGIVLVERSFELADTTTMRFSGARLGDDSLKGTWFNVRSGRRFAIRLARAFQLDAPAAQPYADYAILQDAELDSAYFRLLVSRKAGESPTVSGIRIHRKGGDELLQELRFDAAFLGAGGVSVDDYNFDGHREFSVFEASYAGPNTSSLYFLYNPRTKTYFLSKITGISLEFDPVSKRITDVNQCCAGSQVTRTEYKLVNNEMVELRTRCFILNHKTGQLEERPSKQCR